MPILPNLVIVVISAILVVAVNRARKTSLKSEKEVNEELRIWAWWVEVATVEPRCTYYFGPFTSKQSASVAQPGYIEDLEAEGAQGISVQIKWCKPSHLTSYEDELEESLLSN